MIYHSVGIQMKTQMCIRVERCVNCANMIISQKVCVVVELLGEYLRSHRRADVKSN